MKSDPLDPGEGRERAEIYKSRLGYTIRYLTEYENPIFNCEQIEQPFAWTLAGARRKARKHLRRNNEGLKLIEEIL